MNTTKHIVFVILLNFILGSGVAVSNYDSQINSFDSLRTDIQNNHQFTVNYKDDDKQTTILESGLGFIEGALNLAALFKFFIGLFFTGAFLSLSGLADSLATGEAHEQIIWLVFFILQMAMNISLVVLFYDKIKGIAPK